jgi:hypothetical protein
MRYQHKGGSKGLFDSQGVSHFHRLDRSGDSFSPSLCCSCRKRRCPHDSNIPMPVSLKDHRPRDLSRPRQLLANEEKLIGVSTNGYSPIYILRRVPRSRIGVVYTDRRQDLGERPPSHNILCIPNQQEESTRHIQCLIAFLVNLKKLISSSLALAKPRAGLLNPSASSSTCVCTLFVSNKYSYFPMLTSVILVDSYEPDDY